VGCPACGSASRRYLFSKDAREYVRCEDCGFVYSLPRPDGTSLSKLYDDVGQKYFTDPRMLAFYFAPHRFERELRFISKHLTQGSCLMDVGCCVGAFVHAAGKHGYQASGIDISTAAVNYGKERGLNLRVENMLATEYSRPLDAVCLWATLEHVQDPVAFLRKSFDIIKPGGWLFSSVPNFSGFSQRVLGKKFNLVAVEHLNYFTPKVFTTVVSSVGFEVRSVSSFGFNPIGLVRDFVRGDSQLDLSEQMNRATLTLKIVSSPLRYVQRFTERVLDAFGHAADVLLVAAQKPASSEKY
jgi:SAM-dependent methyltransferase